MKRLLLPIYDEWAACTACGLSGLRGSDPVCVGNGNNNPDYLIVVDSPTAADVSSGGYLLGGDASDLLTDLLDAAHIPLDSVYVTGAVGCRPYSIVPATEAEPERESDRNPEPGELVACSKRLADLVYATDPRVIIALGDVAWKALVKKKDRDSNGLRDISRACASLFHTETLGKRGFMMRYPVMAAYSLRQINSNPNSASQGPLNATIRAMSLARNFVEWVRRRETVPTEAT